MNDKDFNTFTTNKTSKITLDVYKVVSNADSVNIDDVRESLNTVLKRNIKNSKNDMRLINMIELSYKILKLWKNDPNIDKMIQNYKDGTMTQKECYLRLKELINNETSQTVLADYFIIFDYLLNIKFDRDDYLIGTVNCYQKKFKLIKSASGLEYRYAYDIVKERTKMDKVKSFLQM